MTNDLIICALNKDFFIPKADEWRSEAWATDGHGIFNYNFQYELHEHFIKFSFG